MSILLAILLGLNAAVLIVNVASLVIQRRVHVAYTKKIAGELAPLTAFVSAIADSTMFPPALRDLARDLIVKAPSVVPQPWRARYLEQQIDRDVKATSRRVH